MRLEFLHAGQIVGLVLGVLVELEIRAYHTYHRILSLPGFDYRTDCKTSIPPLTQTLGGYIAQFGQ